MKNIYKISKISEKNKKMHQTAKKLGKMVFKEIFEKIEKMHLNTHHP